MPLVLTDSGTSATFALTTLSSLGAEDVWLFGSDTSFTLSFVAAVSGAHAIAGEIVDATPFGRSSEALAATPVVASLLVVRSDRPTDVSIAASEAPRSGASLVVLDGTEVSGDVGDLFASYENAHLLVIGDGSVIPPDAVSEGQLEYLDIVDTGDAFDAAFRVAQRAIFEGARGTDIVVAPIDQNASIALASILARYRGGIVQLAGAAASLTTASQAASYLSLWQAEIQAVTLVGTGLVAGDLAAVSAPTTVSRAPAPSFRVANVVSAAGSYTVSVTAVAGATTYTAYDGEGNLAATSSTPELTITGTPGILALYADGSAGQLGHLELRSNEYLTATGRGDAIVATISGDKAHLVFLGDVSAPRVVSRTETDPFAEAPITYAPELIAVTCGQAFTDSGLDPTKQWSYTATLLSSANQLSCDPLAPAGPSPDSELLVAGVSLPPTEFPFFERDSDLIVEVSPETERGPAHTVAEAGVLAAIEGAKTASRGPGDDWSDVLFRYQAFIPEQYLALPSEVTGDLLRPLLAFGGDNRSWGQTWGTSRFKIDTVVKFGSDHNVTSSVEMGITYKYKCSIYITLCVELDHQRQVSTQVGQSLSPHTATTADVNVWSKTYNPLSALAPAIDMTMKYKLCSSGSFLIGVHDKMPRHEVYFGLPFSEWTPIYQSGVHLLPCLYGVENQQPQFDAACRARINVQF